MLGSLSRPEHLRGKNDKRLLGQQTMCCHLSSEHGQAQRSLAYYKDGGKAAQECFWGTAPRGGPLHAAYTLTDSNISLLALET